MTFAEKINAYLTPVRRQAIYQVIGVIGVVLTAVSPTMSTQVAQWTQIVFALGTIGSLILGAIVTKAAQWPAIYSGMAALVAALTGASLLTDGAANIALRLLQAAVTVAPLVIILARTDTSTPTGSPASEVASVTPVAPMAPVVAFPSVTAIPGATVYDPANGTPPISTPSV